MHRGWPLGPAPDNVGFDEGGHVMRIQLLVLRSEPNFVRLGDQLKEPAKLLEGKSAIPMVR